MQVVVVVLLIPVSAALLGSANAQVAVLLISTEPGCAMACRQNGVPLLAETVCEDGVTAMDVTA